MSALPDLAFRWAVVALAACSATPVQPDAAVPDGGAARPDGGNDGGAPPVDAAERPDGGPRTPVRFVDVTEAAGLAFPEPPVEGAPDCYRALMARGAATGDFDGDGDLDLFVARIGAADLFFLNDGHGVFEEAAEAAGLDHDGSSNAALAFDLEGDGDLDLYVTALAPDHPRLYVNDGEAGFTEEAAERGVRIAPAGCHDAWSASAADVDGDGDLDLHTTAWEAPFHTERNDRARLFLNDGTGHFVDGTAAANLVLEGRSSFTSAFGDLDDDGDVDLALCSDWGRSGLFLNDGSGRFREITDEAGVAVEESGMGCDLGDVDGDGDLDLYVTSILDPRDPCPSEWGCLGNRLYRNDGTAHFTDVTEEAGVMDGSWGWGTAFFDYDLDGDLDLAVANGFQVELFEDDALRLFENDGTGHFREVAAARGLVELGQGRGLLPFDHDGDGDLDLLVVNRGGLARLYENRGGEAHPWLRVALREPESANPFAVGAQLRLWLAGRERPQRRDLHANSNFTTGRPPEALFAVPAPIERLEIRWPNGETQRMGTMEPGQRLVIARP